jgi:hypothetical protein
MATLTLELPDDLADRLQTLVEVAGRSADAYVVASLVWYLGNIEKVHRETGDAIAPPKPASWDSFFAAIQGVEVPADFLDDRERFPNGHACTRPPLYRQLEALPEWMTGEIIDGQVHTEPHPAAPVLFVGTALPAALHSIADTKNAWYVLWRPELHLVLDTEVLVPDLAAWRYERMRWDQEDQRFTVVPDWVCEVLSPVTRSKDREIKLPIYARFGVSFVWLIDPWARTLEAYALEAGAWRELGRFAGPDSCSGLQTSAVRPANIAIFDPD